MSALAEALVAAQLELPTAISRDSQGRGYRYTSLDALIAATRPVLNAHGLVMMQWPTTIERGDALVPALTTRLVLNVEENAASISWQDTMPLYLEDKTMQGLGAAITYARRYAWAAALGIASEEDTDAATVDMAGEEIPF